MVCGVLYLYSVVYSVHSVLVYIPVQCSVQCTFSVGVHACTVQCTVYIQCWCTVPVQCSVQCTFSVGYHNFASVCYQAMVGKVLPQGC